MHDHSPSRRTVLAGLAAGSLAPAAAFAQGAAPAAPPPRRIDVHHHFYPPELKQIWQDWLTRHNQGQQFPPVAQWTAERSLEEMDKNGVATAIISLASLPGVWFDGGAKVGNRMSRLCNEYGARMVGDHKGRFGLFAMLPMIDVDSSLKEIAYAFDTLKADGVGIPTSYGDKWPGDPFFAPIFDELNRRKAVVFFHPRSPNCCGSLMAWEPDGLLEYPYDTGRTVLSLLFTGSLRKYADIRWIFPQDGGAIPMLEGRVVTLTKFYPKLAEVAPGGIDAELKKLFYETANSAYRPTMRALLDMVPPSQVLFGTDYPYVTVTQNATDLDRLGLSDETLAAINAGTAARLFPRLRA
jgi:6-methylsalicylate decarboxylase